MPTIRAAALIASVLTAPALAGVTIEQVAPERTVVVLGVRNVDAAMTSFRQSPLGAFFDQAAGEDAGDPLGDLLPPEMMDALHGVDEEDGPSWTPTGAAGAALFVVPDPTTGFPTPAILVMGEYGDGAEQVAGMVRQRLERGQEDGALALTVGELSGRPLFTIKLPEAEPEPVDDLDDFGNFDGQMNPLDMIADVDQVMDAFRTLHVVRSGEVIMLSSHLESLDNALSTLDGRPRPMLASRQSFRWLQRQQGQSDLYGALLSGDLGALASTVDPMGFTMMFQPMLRAVVGQIDAMGFGLEVGEAGSVLDERFCVYMPAGKAGLPALIDVPAPRVDPPAMVDAGTVTYTSMSFRFEGLVPLVRRVMASNPMMQAQFGREWADLEPDVQAVCATLGTRVHMMSQVQPDTPFMPMGMVMSVECGRPEQFRTSMDRLAGRMGMTAKQIDGTTMFVMDSGQAAGGMMAPADAEQAMSITASNGQVLMGPQASVRKLLARPAGAGAGHLADEPVFRRAVAQVPGEPIVAWGFSNLAPILDLADGGAMGQGGPEDQLNAIRTIMGPGVWYVRSIEDGFVGTFRQLPAPEAAAAAGESD